VAGRYNRCIHRDFKTYSHYAYGVTDEGFSSLQIFDLQYLPDSVHVVYDSDELVIRSHNIFIDNGRLYVCAHKYWNNGALESSPISVLSLADPEHPQLMAHIPPQMAGSEVLFDYVHDAYVRGDTAYLSTGTPGLFIYDLHDPANPKYIQSITPPYTGSGYNHSGWLSQDGDYYIFSDETWYTPIKITDISNIKLHKPNPDIAIVSVFGSNNELGSIPHNAFVKDNYVYVAYYHEGAVVFDMSNPALVKKVAQYDTYPQNNELPLPNRYKGYSGAWGIYPFFPSGTIAVSDMTNGLYLFQLDTFPVYPEQVDVKLLSNPFNQEITLQVGLNQEQPFSVVLYDMLGRVMTTIPFNGLRGDNIYHLVPENYISNGVYLLEVSSGSYHKLLRILKV
jgi:choice-of-anchor B domain-containing protein